MQPELNAIQPEDLLSVFGGLWNVWLSFSLKSVIMCIDFRAQGSGSVCLPVWHHACAVLLCLFESTSEAI